MKRGDRVLCWRCAVCGTTVDVATPHPFVCPRATPRDRYHVLHPLTGPDPNGSPDRLDDANPFVAYGPRMAWWAFGATHGMTEPALVALAREVGGDFVVTPFASHKLDVRTAAPMTVWIKDETGNVGGSHKSRHLAGILLHLRAAEALGLGDAQRPPLAIASCGNAAIAAATLAQGQGWPLLVFVPEWAPERTLALIESLGADIEVCPRRDDDPPGDPALLRFREAVAAGALPFTVQGPENALCLDAGRSIGWELANTVGRPSGPAALDRVLVQVGGGALAACVGWGLGAAVRLDTVQAQGCAPLARAWWRAKDAGYADAQVPGRWQQLMMPWGQGGAQGSQQGPASIAEGILDDETYDWLADFAVMMGSGGRPIVVPEEAIADAVAIAATTGIDVSPTGSAGLAGLLVADGKPAAEETVAVVFSGVRR
jgi:threonine synthase